MDPLCDRGKRDLPVARPREQRFFFDQPTIAALLIPSRHPVGHSGYVGLGLFVLSLAGLLHSILSRREGARPVLALYLVAYFLVLGHWLPFYDWIPGVRLLFSAGRYLVFFVFFAAAGAAFAVEPLRDLAPGSRTRALAALLAIVLLDVAPSTFTVYRHPLPGGEAIERAFASLAEVSPWREAGSSIPPARALLLPRRERDFLNAVPIPFLARHATTAPGLWGVGPSGPFLFRAWVTASSEMAAGGGLGEASRDLLALNAVGKLVTAEGEVLDLGSPPLAVWARRAESIGDPEIFPPTGWDRPFAVLPRPAAAVREIPTWMGYDRVSGTAERVGVRGSSLPWSSAPAVDDGDPGFRVFAQAVTQTTVRLRVEARTAGHLRIAVSHSPHQRALVDGAEVPRGETIDHMTAIALPAGEHEVVVEAGWSGLRKALAAVALAWVVGCAVAAFAGRLRRSGSC